jgi:hypothetical protein
VCKRGSTSSTSEPSWEVKEELVGGPRAKVGDLDIGGDLLRISQRCNHEDADVEMGVGDANETGGVGFQT